MGNEDNDKKSEMLKNISEIIGYNFFVDSYQRGYKWDKIQVEDILSDISSIECFNDNAKEYIYCLQPLVLKKIGDERKNEFKEKGIVYNNNEICELIDGQQRMTTILMILAFIDKKNIDNLIYYTREGSHEFLKEIKNLNEINENDWAKYIGTENNKEYDNVDNYHFFNAYQTIKDWFKDKDKNTFKNKLLNKTYVLWYDVSDKEIDSRDIFTRINSGKIPLTNSELIKALFLSCTKSENQEIKELKQTEIAQEWDKIEYTLQNDEFWYFITSDNPSPNRIEIIFRLMARKINDENKYNIEPKNNDFFEFMVFDKYLKDKNIEDLWDEIKRYFMTLEEWYEDIELFNLIGFFTTRDFLSIEKIIELKNNTPKDKFKDELKDIIIEKFKDIKLSELSYKENKDKENINSILLLFNIVELSNSSRFSFSKFKEKKWSLEHIHAQNEETLKGFDKIKSYIKDFLDYIAKVYKDKTKELNDYVNENFKDYDNKEFYENNYEEYQTKFRGFLDKSKELLNLDSIDNLALLSREINSSLNNGFFDEKRKIIINKDKKGEFIPPATKNIFLKYYSDEVETNLYFWGQTDRENYFKKIEETLNNIYLKMNKTVENKYEHIL
ncbi:MAG: DUF262 domain-containing protein [Spirochaetes bacterium]|nr:DUF262 domain-containing protein [Spirochaetota bacterium]